MGVRDLTVALIHIFLIISDVEHLLMCFLAICISIVFGEMSTSVLCPFFNGVVLLLLSCDFSLYVLDIKCYPVLNVLVMLNVKCVGPL